MPLPTLDDRDFESLLAEAKRRISVHTPEWTNFEGESDPGVTMVELFAFLTDNLLYRANRIPELNRGKFLQLMGLNRMAAAAAQGVITIKNERGPVEALAFDQGLVVAAGKVNFLTRDGVTVLPVKGQVFYKKKLGQNEDGLRVQELQDSHEAVRMAIEAAGDQGTGQQGVELVFYEPTVMETPVAGAPLPVVDMVNDTLDRCLYLALLAPKGVDPSLARQAIANEVLSIGVSPALAETVPPLRPHSTRRVGDRPAPLRYEVLDRPEAAPGTRYSGLTVIRDPDVLNQIGIVQLQLPDASRLQAPMILDPLFEGVDDLPPRIDDDDLSKQLVTWIRIRVALPEEGALTPVTRVSWAGVNAARVTQAVPVTSEALGQASGDPDQVFTLAHRPVLIDSLRVAVETDSNTVELWRMTDDLLAARPDEQVFTLDAASGVIQFGGPYGARPAAGRRLFATYEYGGGLEGNVSIGAIKTSPDVRLGGLKIENPIATWGGDTAETIAEAERTLPATIRHRERLVTERDFKDVTYRTPGVDVGRAEVLSLFKPDAPDVEASGVVTVMIIPQFDPVRPRWPSPDRLFLNTVCGYLDERRLITTEIYVRGPEYLDVYVTVGIEARAGFFPDVVQRDVRGRMYEYLSSLPPGGADGGGWELGRTLLLKDLEAVATRVPGVAFVRSLQFGVGSSEPLEERSLTGLELPLLRAISVVAGEAEPLASVVEGGAGGLVTPGTRQVPVPLNKAVC